MGTDSKPQLGDELPAFYRSPKTLELLTIRRSSSAGVMTDPGPTEQELAKILDIAMRVPDHRRVNPFRFVLFQGAARAAFGQSLGAVFAKNNPAASSAMIEVEKNRFTRAPVVVAVISAVDKAHKTPEWEQILTCGAVCQNLLIAASASGFAGSWLTEWYAFDPDIKAVLGLSSDERVAGFIYLGGASEMPRERPRPTPADLITAWQAPD